MLERSLVLLKPDAVRRALCGEIIRRLEAKGLRIAGMKMLRVSPAQYLLRKADVPAVWRPIHPVTPNPS